MTNLTSSIQVSEALSAIRMGMEFAYKQGLHEFGSDPVETVETALAMRSKDHSMGDDVREKYEELIYAVSIKHPQEDRHETALRYIRQAEGGSTAIGSQSIEGERADD